MYEIKESLKKPAVFKRVENDLKKLGIKIQDQDSDRPWGGFFVIETQSLGPFVDHFFPNMQLKNSEFDISYRPKILIVEPGKRLSWQYHNRRSEHWKIIRGPIGVMTSDADQFQPLRRLKSGDKIQLELGERHRLVGLNEWGIVAEIWQHEDPENPSDEEDIVRVSDDFGR